MSVGYERDSSWKTLTELKARLGEEHPSVASSFNNLATLYYSQGRYREAESLLIKALSIAEFSLGVDHPSTAAIRENLKLLGDNQ